MLACSERYKDGQNFLTLFNPDMQTRYCREENIRQCYMGAAPSLGVVTRAFGEQTTNIWIAAQLRDLANYSGCKDKLNEQQYRSIVDVIRSTYGFMKVTQLMHFFHRFKSGCYGYFYGAVDGLTIMTALKRFAEERMKMLEAYQTQEEERRKAEDYAEACRASEAFAAARAVCHMTLAEYLSHEELYPLSLDELAEVGWLFRFGYESEAERQRQREGRRIFSAARKVIG